MRVLVTGGTGFVGRRLTRLLRAEHEVFEISHRPATSTRGVIHADLSEGLDVAALPPRVDAVIHLAQSELYREFPERAEHIYAVNVDSTFRLLEFARKAGARRFILASSGGIYGYAEDPAVESRPPDPPDFYLRTKQLAEVVLFAYQAFFDCIALRPFFIYGTGQRPTMFIPRLTRNVLAGRPVKVAPPNGLLVNPIHVDDAALAFKAALTARHHGPINIAGPDVVSLVEIVGIMGARLGREPLIERTESSPGNVIGDVSLMNRVLGPARVKFRDGVLEVCQEALAELTPEQR